MTTELQPLFDAMKEGKMIHSVTCKIGSTDENITITSFTAQMYEVAINEQLNSSWCHDLVTIYVKIQ